MNYYIAFTLLIASTCLAQIQGCFREDFNDLQSSKFSSECSHFSYPIWQFETYSEGTVEPPPASTSNGYIVIRDINFGCIAKDVPFAVAEGSEIHVKYFATGLQTTLQMRVFDAVTGWTTGMHSMTPVLNAWTTRIFTITTSSTSAQLINFIGSAPLEGSLIIDQVSYVDNPDDYDNCVTLST